MKTLFPLLLWVGFVYAQYVNRVVMPVRPVYISKLISQEHVYAIHGAMSEYNRYSVLWDGALLVETTDKNENHIRIEYADFNGCSMNAVSMSDGHFQVSDTTIGFQQHLDPIMTQCIVLHEIGHSLGLGHMSNGTNSVMRKTIALQEYTCTLKEIDLLQLHHINHER